MNARRQTFVERMDEDELVRYLYRMQTLDWQGRTYDCEHGHRECAAYAGGPCRQEAAERAEAELS